MMLGIDASSIHVVADNGAPVDDAMVVWAQELQPGTWYTLDHNGASAQVQYAWQSQRKQLHLFAAVDGSSYLIQLRRLAAYLQAGLLVAQDEEGLTLRATRDALAKLDANPRTVAGLTAEQSLTIRATGPMRRLPPGNLRGHSAASAAAPGAGTARQAGAPRGHPAPAPAAFHLQGSRVHAGACYQGVPGPKGQTPARCSTGLFSDSRASAILHPPPCPRASKAASGRARHCWPGAGSMRNSSSTSCADSTSLAPWRISAWQPRDCGAHGWTPGSQKPPGPAPTAIRAVIREPEANARPRQPVSLGTGPR